MPSTPALTSPSSWAAPFTCMSTSTARMPSSSCPPSIWPTRTRTASTMVIRSTSPSWQRRASVQQGNREEPHLIFPLHYVKNQSAQSGRLIFCVFGQGMRLSVAADGDGLPRHQRPVKTRDQLLGGDWLRRRQQSGPVGQQTQDVLRFPALAQHAQVQVPIPLTQAAARRGREAAARG